MWTIATLLFLAGPAVRFVAVAPAESLRVTVTGDGPAVVLLPGLFGSDYAFRRVVPGLTSLGLRVVVVEPLGVGFSARPARADYSLTAQAARVAAVLDTLEIRGALVVSHAIGTSIALRLALARADLVSGILSLEGGPVEAATTPGFRNAMRLAPLFRIGGARLVRSQVRRLMVDASGDPSWVSDAVVRGYTAGPAADVGATLEAYRGMAAAREPEPLAPRLAAVRCPVRLLLGGAPHGIVIPASELDLMRRALPDFAAQAVAGAGHFLFEERPDAVVDAIRRMPGVPARAARRQP